MNPAMAALMATKSAGIETLLTDEAAPRILGKFSVFTANPQAKESPILFVAGKAFSNELFVKMPHGTEVKLRQCQLLSLTPTDHISFSKVIHRIQAAGSFLLLCPGKRLKLSLAQA